MILVLLLSLFVGIVAGPSVSFAEDARPRAIENAPIENLYRLSPAIYSGAQPEGQAAFETLKELGVQTIVSVDGTKPDVAAAKKHGLRYVHLPIGYDGISDERMLQMVKAAQTLPGPFFVHCHHGRHRGPAAAAIFCGAAEEWNAKQRRAWLEQAGTSPDYPGLFQSVEQFQMPGPAALAKVAGEFPEVAKLASTVAAMVAIDGIWERLREIEKHDFRTPPDHPDIAPDQEALQLAEHFRELVRSDDSQKRGADYLKRMTRAAEATATLQEHLKAIQEQRLEDRISAAHYLMRDLKKQCAACHKVFRNGR